MSIRIGNQIISSGRSIGVADSINNQNTTSLITDVYNWIGTSQEYEDQEIAEEHPEWVCFITDDETHDNQEFELIAYTARNVGDIFYTSRSDSWLNGAVECNGGIYQISDYSGEESINTLLQNGNLAYLSIAEYDALIEAQGWCEKFGWDGIDAATFKVPTLTARVVQENNIPVIGNGEALGFITETNTSVLNSHNESLGDNRGWVKTHIDGNPASIGDLKVHTDPTKSGIIADLSSDSANLRVMIQLSTGFNDESIETLHSLTETVSDLQEVKQDKATALNYNYITNCITNIPKDIVVDLTAGLLTLKAGSKVYYPDGFEEDGTTRKFGSYTVSEDREVHFPTTSVTAGKGWIIGLYDEDGAGTFWGGPSTTISSDTEPAEPFDNLVWYDTANNIIKVWQDTEQGWTTELHGYKYILPPCLFTVSSEKKVISVDQVFNGFGYIGSTVFALPGIQVIVPAGKDLTGKPRSTIFTSDKVSTYTPDPIQNNHTYTLVFDGSVEASYDLVTYNLQDNVNYLQGQPYAKAIVGTVAFTENSVTNLTNKATFQAVDYNDFVKYQAADHKIIEFMEPTVDNDYTWYRLYSDGWVEQGQNYIALDTNGQTFTMPIAMIDNRYNIQCTGVSGTNKTSTSGGVYISTYDTRTTSTFSCYAGDDTSFNACFMSWQVSGMAAV